MFSAHMATSDIWGRNDLVRRGLHTLSRCVNETTSDHTSRIPPLIVRSCPLVSANATFHSFLPSCPPSCSSVLIRTRSITNVSVCSCTGSNHCLLLLRVSSPSQTSYVSRMPAGLDSTSEVLLYFSTSIHAPLAHQLQQTSSFSEGFH